jgi:hypothetical protein
MTESLLVYAALALVIDQSMWWADFIAENKDMA